MSPIRFTILGEQAQKGNQRRIVTSRMSLKPVLIKSAKALAWYHSATLQLKAAGIMGRDAAIFTEPVRLTVHAYYASNRPDLDATVLQDVLQSRYMGAGKKRKLCLAGVYENDRLVKELHLFHHIDAECPRAEVCIERI